MNLQKSIQRLVWRFGDGQFTPNQNDADALQFLIDWIKREKEHRINENRYFAKMVIYTLMREIEFFGDTKLAERKIHDVLNKPLEYWYDRYRLLLTLRDFNQTKEILNIKDLVELWDEHKDECGCLDMDGMRHQYSENKKLIFENKDELLISLKRIDQKEVNGILNLFITELLNEYGNIK